jgi:exoribonuclease R
VSGKPLEPLETIAQQCSDLSRRAKIVQQEFDAWKILQLLAQHVGQTFEARIGRVNGTGCLVTLQGYGLSTLAPFSHGPAHARAMRYEAFGATEVHSGKRWEVGMRLSVHLEGIDWHRRQPTLTWAESPAFSPHAA